MTEPTPEREQCRSASLATPSRNLALPNLEMARHARSLSLHSAPTKLDTRRLDLSQERVLKAASLVKSRMKGSRKNTRYFVLTSHRLVYYKSETDFRANGPFKRSFLLDTSVITVSGATMVIQYSHMDSARWNKRQVAFPSESEASDWEKAISEYKGYKMQRCNSTTNNSIAESEASTLRDLMATDEFKSTLKTRNHEELGSIPQDSKEECSSPDSLMKKAKVEQSLHLLEEVKATEIDKLKSEEASSKRTPEFEAPNSQKSSNHTRLNPEVFLCSKTPSRNLWMQTTQGTAELSLIYSGTQWPISSFRSRLPSLSTPPSSGVTSQQYFNPDRQSARRLSASAPHHHEWDVVDIEQEGIPHPPHDTCVRSFSAFFQLMHDFDVRTSREDLLGIIQSLKRCSTRNRNGEISGLQSLKSSLEQLQEAGKTDPTASSTKALPSIEMEDGTKLKVHRCDETGENVLKIESEGTGGENEQTETWSNVLRQMLIMAQEPVTVHYTQALMSRVIRSALTDPNRYKLCTLAPKAVFAIMGQNLTCVRDYQMQEITDVMWVNLHIFYKLISRQTELAKEVLEIVMDCFQKYKGKIDVRPSVVHTANLLINDMNISLELLNGYSRTFMTLKPDSSNYLFLHSFLEDYFRSRSENVYPSEEDMLRAAQRWVSRVIFRSDMIEFVLRALEDNLAPYFVLRRKLLVMTDICGKGDTKYISILEREFVNEEGLLRALKLMN